MRNIRPLQSTSPGSDRPHNYYRSATRKLDTENRRKIITSVIFHHILIVSVRRRAQVHCGTLYIHSSKYYCTQSTRLVIIRVIRGGRHIVRNHHTCYVLHGSTVARCEFLCDADPRLDVDGTKDGNALNSSESRGISPLCEQNPGVRFLLQTIISARRWMMR